MAREVHRANSKREGKTQKCPFSFLSLSLLALKGNLLAWLFFLLPPPSLFIPVACEAAIKDKKAEKEEEEREGKKTRPG